MRRNDHRGWLWCPWSSALFRKITQRTILPSNWLLGKSNLRSSCFFIISKHSHPLALQCIKCPKMSGISGGWNLKCGRSIHFWFCLFYISVNLRFMIPVHVFLLYKLLFDKAYALFYLLKSAEYSVKVNSTNTINSQRTVDKLQSRNVQKLRRPPRHRSTVTAPTWPGWNSGKPCRL